jgi:DNA replication protein DnaC
VELTDVMRLTRAVKSTWRHNAETTEESVLDHYASLDLLLSMRWACSSEARQR